ncbi:MAG: 5-formyltetrahydrofolate cyclo-ligase [Planctomycetota bacterium]
MSDAADVIEAKRALRIELRAKRAAMSDAARRAASLSIAESVIERVGGTPAAVGGAVFCYVGVKDEVSTRPLLERWLRAGVEMWVPLLEEAVGDEGDEARSGVPSPRPSPGGRGGAMRAVRLDAMRHLQRGVMGVPTCPCGVSMGGAPAWVVLPCVGVTRDGRRLGQGGGHYDRYLASLGEAKVKTVALAFEVQVVEEVPGEAHDQRIGAVCTESGWVDCFGGV